MEFYSFLFELCAHDLAFLPSVLYCTVNIPRTRRRVLLDVIMKSYLLSLLFELLLLSSGVAKSGGDSFVSSYGGFEQGRQI